jgi:uncharacterized repeat protein (TIGR03803 family)
MVGPKTVHVARICTLLLFSLALAITSVAQTFETLTAFDKTNGAGPVFQSLVQGHGRSFYGTTVTGGNGQSCPFPDVGCGTLFKVTVAGILTTVYSFCAEANCADGLYPHAGVIRASDGNFYGTTQGLSDGTCQPSCGTVFKIDHRGKLTTLYNFCPQTGCPDGNWPIAGLLEATDGDFYGTTYAGGSSHFCPYPIGCGTIFRITRGGNFTTLYSFCQQAGCLDGRMPWTTLVQGEDGNVYGVTAAGGNASDAGTFFKLVPSGELTTLYSFCSTGGKTCLDGSTPVGLMQARDGNFYGTTQFGGVGDFGKYQVSPGTLFRMSPQGELTTLYTFCRQTGCPDGLEPAAGVIEASDGNFYGTLSLGGAFQNNFCTALGCGAVFKVTQSGDFTTLHTFCENSGCPDGAWPLSGLIQDRKGVLYGTASGGVDATQWGTIFMLSTGR